jgi:hypothetical protein
VALDLSSEPIESSAFTIFTALSLTVMAVPVALNLLKAIRIPLTVAPVGIENPKLVALR